jgi:hypothetical protein
MIEKPAGEGNSWPASILYVEPFPNVRLAVGGV